MVDDIVLNFQDSLLRKSDVELLQEGQWLNDKMIGFMFEYFEYEQFTDLHDVLFVNPDVVQCIKLSEGGDVSMFLEPLQVETKTKIFLPVNSHVDPAATGGTHWSLLVYDKDQNGFKHYDSAATMNNSQAKTISKVIKPFLKVAKDVGFAETQCPQQTNAHDCGMYVICVTEYLCEQQRKRQKSLDEITPELVRRKRQDIKRTIEHLRLKR